MPHDGEAAEFTAYWRQTLTENDRAAHAAEAERALQLEADALRLRCAELSAALTQARAAIEVRHQLLEAQGAALTERDRALNETRTAYDAVVHSRRWRAFEVLGQAARRGRRALTRLRGHA